MISITKNTNGSYTASALVADTATPFAWLEWATFYGYPKREIAKLFREYCASKSLKIVKG